MGWSLPVSAGTLPGIRPESANLYRNVVTVLHRLLARLWPFRRGRKIGVRPNGAESFIVTIDQRTYWVHAQPLPNSPRGYLVRASDTRDITHAPTVVAAPPAPEQILPEVRRRLSEYFAQDRSAVTFS